MAEEHSFLYVPEALEDQILVRLPVKSIVRFKSVCRRWHSLFRSKAFEEFYFGLQNKEAFVPTSEDLELIFPDLNRDWRNKTWVIGPLSNGIYALTSIVSIRLNQYNPRCVMRTLEILLFNPATRRVKSAAPFPDERSSGISLISSRVSCGIDDDYRVVVLINYEGKGIVNDPGCYLVFFYTWRTGEWEKLVDYDPDRRRIGLPQATDVFKEAFSVYDNMMACSQKLLNGCWHWMIKIKYVEEVEMDYFRFGVLSFDFERKSLELMRGPLCEPTYYADVFVLQDHLAAIVVSDNFEADVFGIWRKTNTAWSNIYCVNSSQSCMGSTIIVHDVDYYQVEEEEVRIRRLILDEEYIEVERHTFDENGHQVEIIDQSNPKISLSVGGISKFTPTFESLPL